MFGGMNFQKQMHTFIRSVQEQEDSPTEMRALHFMTAYSGLTAITVFMILLESINLYFLLLLKTAKSVLKNEELRVYLGEEARRS